MVFKMAMYKLLTVVENAFSSTNTSWIFKPICTSRITYVEELLDYPEKPRRPLNAYVRYFINVRKKFMRDGASIKSGIMQEISKAWNEMPDSEKQKYYDEFSQERLKYLEKCEEYNNTLTKDQKEGITKLKEKIKKTKVLSKMHDSSFHLKDDLEKLKPVQPMTSFLRFYKESLNLGKANTKESAQQWKLLPESEKEKYRSEYEKEKEIYLKNLKDWECKMIQEGKLDVLRSKTIKELSKKY